MLRGCRRQKAGAVANLLVNWALGLPLVVLLAFKLQMGAVGERFGSPSC